MSVKPSIIAGIVGAIAYQVLVKKRAINVTGFLSGFRMVTNGARVVKMLAREANKLQEKPAKKAPKQG